MRAFAHARAQGHVVAHAHHLLESAYGGLARLERAERRGGAAPGEFVLRIDERRCRGDGTACRPSAPARKKRNALRFARAGRVRGSGERRHPVVELRRGGVRLPARETRRPANDRGNAEAALEDVALEPVEGAVRRECTRIGAVFVGGAVVGREHDERVARDPEAVEFAQEVGERVVEAGDGRCVAGGWFGERAVGRFDPGVSHFDRLGRERPRDALRRVGASWDVEGLLVRQGGVVPSGSVDGVDGEIEEEGRVGTGGDVAGDELLGLCDEEIGGVDADGGVGGVRAVLRDAHEGVLQVAAVVVVGVAGEVV